MARSPDRENPSEYSVGSITLEGNKAPTPTIIRQTVDGLRDGKHEQAHRIHRLLREGKRIFIGVTAGKYLVANVLHPKEEKERHYKRDAVITVAKVAGAALATAGLIELILISRKRARRKS